MALKTFNIDSEVYKQFSKHCKREGLSMSRKIDNYIRAELSRIRCDVKGAVESIDSIKLPEAQRETENKDNEEHSFKKYC